MATNFDLNRGIENKKTRVFVITSIVFLLLFFATAISIQMYKGKYVKTPIFETNSKEILKDTVAKRDTTIVNNNQKTEINIDKNHGDINLGK